MSNTPAKPDGSDPRVLTPSEDEEHVMVKGAWGASGDAYHTCECRNVVQMRSVREVPISIAEWKGYHECHACITEGEYNDDPSREEQQSTDENVHPTPSIEECAAFRRAILEGNTPADVASDTVWGRTSIYRHATGGCKCEDVSHPPVAHGWHVDTSGEQGDATARVQVSAKHCRVFREQLLKGESRADLAERHAISKTAIARHANGRCNHPPDAHGHPPLSYGWHPIPRATTEDSE